MIINLFIHYLKISYYENLYENEPDRCMSMQRGSGKRAG